MKIVNIILLIFFVMVFTPTKVTGSTVERMIEQNLDALNLKEIESVIDKTSQHSQINFNELILKAIKGELDLSPLNIIKSISKIMFEELYENSSIMRNLLVISFLAALIKNLTESFESKGVGELGFLVSYIMLIMVAFSSFTVAVSITQSLISDLASIMEASVPLLISLIVMSGQVVSAYAFHPIIVFIINIITFFIKDTLIPIVVLATGIHIVNYLTEKEILTKFAELIRTISIWTLKGICFLFISILALQRISSPILNNLAIKTAKSSMGAIPVIGDALIGTVDTVMSFTHAAKSGVIIALIVAVIMLCAIPVIKLLALVAIYKFIAAVTEPICDERIVDCVDSIGNFLMLLIGCVVMVIVMFIVNLVVIMSY